MGGAVGCLCGWRGMTPAFPRERWKLCSIDLQTDGMGRPRNASCFADHLGFLEAVA